MGNVLVIAKDFPPTPGGVEKYSYELCREYQRRGFNVTVVTQASLTQDVEVCRQLNNSSATTPEWKVHRVKRGTQLRVAIRILSALLTMKIKRSNAFDLIHCTTWRASAPLLFTPFKNVPIVVTVHGNEILSTSLVIRSLQRVCFRNASLVVSVSNYTMRLYREAVRLESTRALVSYNGIRPLGHASILSNSRKIKILTVCRLEPRKNLWFAINVFESLCKLGYGDRMEYVIVGSGSELEALKQYATTRIGESVRFEGRVTNEQLVDHYVTSDIFFHPQLENRERGDVEGFGLVVADAMAVGLLVIAGNNGGTSELIEDGVNGYLIDPTDVPKTVSLIAAIVDQPEKNRLLANDALKSARSRFTWEKHTTRILEHLS